MKKKESSLFLGIFIISAAALIFEIALTRVLSVIYWHHFAFLVISTALFGIAASGTYLSLKPLKKELEDSLSLYSILFTATALAGYVTVNKISFDSFRFFLDPFHGLLVLLYYLVLSIPFFALGLCMAASFATRPGDSGRLYFANLAGSGIGALGVLGLFAPLGGSGVIIFSALLALIASFVFSTKMGLLKGLSFTILILLLLFPQDLLEINMSPYKNMNLAMLYPDSRIISTEWNSISRVDVFESGYVRYAPGLSLSYQKTLPPQLGLAVDGDSAGAITKFSYQPIEFTKHLTSTVPYFLKPNSRVLLIETGGGLEIVKALSNNASRITVVEPNPLISKTLANLRDFSALYENPAVEVVDADARVFLRMWNDEFDIIELGLSSQGPASSTGVYALTENYLFTVDAFKEYLSHLSQDGILSITRRLDPPPRESVKVASIAVTALEEFGVEKAENNIASIRSLGTITLLIKSTAFTDDEIAGIRRFSMSRQFDIVYLPGVSDSSTNVYNIFPVDHYHLAFKDLLVGKNRGDFYERYLFDIKPPRDENPFFYRFFRPDRSIDTYKSVGEKWQVFLEGGFILYLLLIQASFLCLFFILFPLMGLKKGERRPKNVGVLAYFFLIGIAFMFVEIPLIQRFILFLGKPVFAISTVLFGLLVFSGLGSLYTHEKPFDLKWLRLILVLLVFTIFIYIFLLPKFIGLVKTNSLTLRIFSAIALLAPLGFLMGMPLPLGIRLLEDSSKSLIPWAWAANGSASTLAAIASVIIAIETSFSLVVALAALSYTLSIIAAVNFFEPHLRGVQSAHL